MKIYKYVWSVIAVIALYFVCGYMDKHDHDLLKNKITVYGPDNLN
jgi:hypothetical protein